MGLDIPLSAWLLILGAAVASWLAGAVWYTVLSRAWIAALGVPPADLRNPDGSTSPTPLIISFLAEVVMAWTVYGLIGHIGQPSLKAGLLTGGLCWLGFVATTVVVNNAYPRRRVMLSVIDAGHWLVVLLLQGAIIGAFAMR